MNDFDPPDLPARYGGHVTVPTSEELLDRFAAVLADLGARHGLSNLRHGEWHDAVVYSVIREDLELRED